MKQIVSSLINIIIICAISAYVISAYSEEDTTTLPMSIKEIFLTSLTRFTIPENYDIDRYILNPNEEVEFYDLTFTLQEVAAENKAILRDPEPLIAVTETNADAICFDYGVWCNTPDRWDVKYYIEEAVVKKLSAAGINMPVSELDVKIVETERPVKAGARPS